MRKTAESDSKVCITPQSQNQNLCVMHTAVESKFSNFVIEYLAKLKLN